MTTEENKELKEVEINFETIDVAKFHQIEEVVTPGWGTKNCCQ